MLLPFVQLELPGVVGLPDGRYLSRDDDGERVLIVQASAAPKAGGRRRRARPVSAGAETEVPLTRLMVTGADAFDGRSQALEWLEATAGDPERRAELVRSATRLINRAINALRASARDPLVQDIGATRALAVRIGFGDGDQLAEGRWTEARELPPPRRGRLDDVDPQSRVAAVLGGRDEVHPAETLLQRARLDSEMGREEEARYGLRAARAALDERPPEGEEAGRRLAKVEEQIRRMLEDG